MLADLPLPKPLADDPRSVVLARLAARVSDIDRSPVLTCLVDLVDSTVLPYLAEQWRVLDDPAWVYAPDEAARRQLVKEAIALWRKRGTPWSVERVLALIGYPAAEVWEHSHAEALRAEDGGYLDGKKLLNGSRLLNGPQAPRSRFLPVQWFEYAVLLHATLASGGRSVPEIVRLCSRYAPRRCRLVAVIEDDGAGNETIHDLR